MEREEHVDGGNLFKISTTTTLFNLHQCTLSKSPYEIHPLFYQMIAYFEQTQEREVRMQAEISLTWDNPTWISPQKIWTFLDNGRSPSLFTTSDSPLFSISLSLCVRACEWERGTERRGEGGWGGRRASDLVKHQYAWFQIITSITTYYYTRVSYNIGKISIKKHTPYNTSIQERQRAWCVD